MAYQYLPAHWQWMRLGDIGRLLRGVSYSKDDVTEQAREGFIPILRATNIQDEKLILSNDLVYAPTKYIKPEQYLLPGDIVVCMSSGSKHLVGKTAQLSQEWTGSFGTFCAAIRPHSICNARYVGYFFSSPEYRQFIREKSSGININNLKPSDFETLKIPLPPLDEQERIVERIESLFSQLDSGVAALKRAQANLKRYKTAVLKAVCEGTLLGKVESGENNLPLGWQWKTVYDVVVSMKNGIYKPSEFYAEEGVACLRMYNIDDGRIVWKNLKRMRLTQDEIDTYILHPKDILINRVNSRELVGKAAVIPDGIEPTIYESKNIRIVVNQEMMDSQFLSYCFEAYGHQYFNFNAQQVVGMASINQIQISQMPIPLPPLNTQKKLVSEVEKRMSIIQELMIQLETALSRAARLRQSILKLAFEGKL